MGCGKEEPHRRSTRESTLPTVGLDYCLPALKDHEPLTVLVITEIYSGAVEAVLVDAKGAADFPVKVVIQAMEAWGLQRAGIFSDQEPAVQSLASAVKAARRAETVITSGPRKDSAIKGRIENMVGMVEGLLRTIILSVQHHYGVTFEPTHPILGWAVRHTGWILTRYAMKDNGMTPYRLLRGKDDMGHRRRVRRMCAL